jgi:hypothetical protein
VVLNGKALWFRRLSFARSFARCGHAACDGRQRHDI